MLQFRRGKRDVDGSKRDNAFHRSGRFRPLGPRHPGRRRGLLRADLDGHGPLLFVRKRLHATRARTVRQPGRFCDRQSRTDHRRLVPHIALGRHVRERAAARHRPLFVRLRHLTKPIFLHEHRQPGSRLARRAIGPQCRCKPDNDRLGEFRGRLVFGNADDDALQYRRPRSGAADRRPERRHGHAQQRLSGFVRRRPQQAVPESANCCDRRRPGRLDAAKSFVAVAGLQPGHQPNSGKRETPTPFYGSARRGRSPLPPQPARRIILRACGGSSAMWRSTPTAAR